MPAIDFPTLADHVGTLPAEGAGRDRQLHRLVDLRASAEAAVALHAAAARTTEGPLASVLAAADAILAGTKDPALEARFRDAVAAPEFLSLLRLWSRELRGIASAKPDTGACTIATAFSLWSWTLSHFAAGTDTPAAAVDELTEAVAPLLAARCLALEVAAAGETELRRDLCHTYAAHAAAAAGATCAELVFGYRRHLKWDAEGCAACYASDELDELEAFIPGIASGARTSIDIIEADGSHPAKEGPCARFDGLDAFVGLRSRLDGCLTGARIAKDRAAAALARSNG